MPIQSLHGVLGVLHRVLGVPHRLLGVPRRALGASFVSVCLYPDGAPKILQHESRPNDRHIYLLQGLCLATDTCVVRGHTSTACGPGEGGPRIGACRAMGSVPMVKGLIIFFIMVCFCTVAYR